MADPVVHITNGVPDAGTGNITTLGQTLLDGAQVTQGAIADAAVAAGASGTMSAKLRATSRDIGAAAASLATLVGANATATEQALQLVQETATAAVLGTTAGAAVVTDAAGTVQQYLRGLVKLIAAGINVVITNANANGRALPSASAPVVLNSMTYVTAAASTTQQCGATGASGDYLDGVLIIPGTTAAGIVQIKDGSGTAITIFAGGGTTPLPTLAPFFVPIGAVSSGGTGGWKGITNANVTAILIGNFT